MYSTRNPVLRVYRIEKTDSLKNELIEPVNISVLPSLGVSGVRFYSGQFIISRVGGQKRSDSIFAIILVESLSSS